MAHDPELGYDPSHLIPEHHISAAQGSAAEAARAFNALIKKGVPKGEAQRRSADLLSTSQRKFAEAESGKDFKAPERDKRRAAAGLPSDIRELGGAKGGEAAWERESKLQEVMSGLGQPVPAMSTDSYPHFQAADVPADMERNVRRHQELLGLKKESRKGGRELTPAELKESSALGNIVYGTSARQAGTRLKIDEPHVGFEKARLRGDTSAMEAERSKYWAVASTHMFTPGDIDTHVELRTGRTIPSGRGRPRDERVAGTRPDMVVCSQSGCDSAPYPHTVSESADRQIPGDSTRCASCNANDPDIGLVSANSPSQTTSRTEGMDLRGMGRLVHALYAGNPYMTEGAQRQVLTRASAAFREAGLPEGISGLATPEEKTIGAGGAIIPGSQDVKGSQDPGFATSGKRLDRVSPIVE